VDNLPFAHPLALPNVLPRTGLPWPEAGYRMALQSLFYWKIDILNIKEGLSWLMKIYKS
jgi:hypothetical protein